MNLDTDKIITDAIRDGFREGLKAKMSNGYNNPFDKLIQEIIESKSVDFRQLLGEALQSCVGDATFREEVKTAVRHVMAKQLVAKFGGELEKQVNTLKSDPMTRARITLAIEEIVKSKT